MEEKQKNLFNSPYVGGRQMSSTLKERLKRSRNRMSPLGPSPRTFASQTFASPCRSTLDPQSCKHKINMQLNESPTTLSHPETCQTMCVSPHLESCQTPTTPSVPQSSDSSLGSHSPSPFVQEHNIISLSDRIGFQSSPSVLRVIKRVDLDESSAASPSGVQSSSYKYIAPKKFEETNEQQTLEEAYSSLQLKIVKNEEKLHKLQLVQKHHNKNKPDELQLLIEKWLAAAQGSITKLFEIHPEPKISLPDLITLLNIDVDVIKYNCEEGIFYEI